MAKGVLKFNLEDPESARSFKRAAFADEAWSYAYNTRELLIRIINDPEEIDILDALDEHLADAPSMLEEVWL